MPPPTGRKSSLAQDGSLSWQQVHVAVVALGEPAAEEQVEALSSLLERFIRENEDPRASPHLRATAPDRLDALVALLPRGDVARHCPQARLLVLRAVKILARRQDVRLRCSQHLMETLVPLLDLGGSGSSKGPPTATPAFALEASEAANAVSNLCFEPANATALLKAGGVDRLLKLLAARGDGADATCQLHTNVASALQTVSFQVDGRAALLKAGGPATVLAVLRDGTDDVEGGSGGAGGGGGAVSSGAAALPGDSKLQQRLGVAAIREAGGLPKIVRLLSSRGLAAPAVGALQNLSLESQARASIQADPAALPALVALLVGADEQAAVCAAGTLANLIQGCAASAAPSDGSCSSASSSASQQVLVDSLSTCLAGAAIYHSLGLGAWPDVAAE